MGIAQIQTWINTCKWDRRIGTEATLPEVSHGEVFYVFCGLEGTLIACGKCTKIFKLEYVHPNDYKKQYCPYCNTLVVLPIGEF